MCAQNRDVNWRATVPLFTVEGCQLCDWHHPAGCVDLAVSTYWHCSVLTQKISTLLAGRSSPLGTLLVCMHTCKNSALAACFSIYKATKCSRSC